MRNTRGWYAFHRTAYTPSVWPSYTTTSLLLLLPPLLVPVPPPETGATGAGAAYSVLQR